MNYHSFDFAPGKCEGCRLGCEDCDPQPAHDNKREEHDDASSD